MTDHLTRAALKPKKDTATTNRTPSSAWLEDRYSCRPALSPNATRSWHGTRQRSCEVVRSCGLSLLSGPRTDDASFGTNMLILFLGLAPSSATFLSEQHLLMGSALSGRREANVPRARRLTVERNSLLKYTLHLSLDTYPVPSPQLHKSHTSTTPQTPFSKPLPPTSPLEITELPC